MPRARFILSLAVVSVLLVSSGPLTPPAHAQSQDPKTTETTTTPLQSPEVDPLKRPLSRKQQKANQRRAKLGELSTPYRKWLEQDVAYIITPEERAAFNQLSNDEERDHFIEIFWVNRDPTPDTVENEYEDEHYRRLEYANEHFGAGIPGWKTDRGRIYILHGPPDEIESHPSGGTYDRSPQEGGGTTSTFPFELWRYRYLEDVGQEVVIEFVDTCMCGDYHMTMDPTEKDALAHTPMGQPPISRFTDNARKFEDLQKLVDVSPPKVRFKDLQEIVSSKITYNVMPFDLLASFVKVTSDTVMMPITIQIKNRDITFANTNGVERGTVNIFGRLTTLSGRVAQTFEDTVQVDVPHELLAGTADNASVYWEALPVYSGHYLLEVVIKDVNGDRIGTWRHSIEVPDYAEDRLAASSLIVADKMEPVPSKIVGSSNFVIGDTYLRPRVPSSTGQPPTFKRDQRISFWMQVYNLSVDQRTHRPSATVEYDVVSQATGKSVIQSQQSSAQMGNIADQITLQKTLSASELQPGVYKLRIKVNDGISGQKVEPETMFAVE